MNNISFQGNLTLTTWKGAKSTFKEYKTSQYQDEMFKQAADKFARPCDVTVLSKKNANYFHKLIEKVVKKPVKNINNEKIIYNDIDNIVFSDKNPALFDGIRVEIDLD